MANNATPKPVEELDAVVIGAGFAGLCMLHKLQNDLGATARLFDKADGVGGTWYWNRYPGARSDTESWVYCYSFDPELYREWKWTERYPRQPEILSYLEHVADRFDLRKNIRLSTTVTKAHYNEATDRWDVETDKGDRVAARFLITGLGLLSAPNKPPFKNEEKFKGRVLQTAAWPKTPIDFKGKRIGVIGTGSTGVQVISELAPIAGHLTVFQRSAQYSVPAANHPVEPAFLEEIADNLDDYFEKVRQRITTFAFEEATIGAMEVSEAERQRVYEKAWQDGGGFNFMFGTFNDIATNPESNRTACDFIKGKIAEMITDPKKREIMTPTDIYARRPLCDTNFYSAINQDNVDVIDVRKHPIIEFTEKGLLTEAGEIELDYVIFATGFDAVTGNFVRIDFQGRGGKKLKDHWKDGPRAFLGLSPSGFPNMFTIYGPPGPFTNQPPAIEWQCQWIAEVVRYAKDHDVVSIEATPEAEQAWLDECRTIEDATLFRKIDWWVSGANIPGKVRSVNFFMGGFGEYMKRALNSSQHDYRGYRLTKAKVLA